MTDIKSILYISPQFPSLSLVFEQNELLGILRNDKNLTILSCRRASKAQMSNVHDFAKPLLEWTLYPSYKNIPLGLLLSVINSPKGVLAVVKYLIVAIANPLAFPAAVAASLIAFGYFPLLQNKRYDWIHADFGKGSATLALMLSELLGCKFSFKVHAFDIFDRRLRYIDPLQSYKMRCASLVVSVHEYGRKILEEMIPDCRDKIKVNYVSVRPDSFKALSPARNSRRFVALGRLEAKKGFNVLLQAASIMKKKGGNFVIDIYGAGPENLSLSRMIQEEQLTGFVCLKGGYKNDNLPTILADCLAVVVPSIVDKNGDMDGIPTVIFEAMSLGRTVVASSISGIPEVVRNGYNGYLVNSGDASQLAERMSCILNEPEESFVMGINGRRYIELNHDYILNAESLLKNFMGLR